MLLDYYKIVAYCLCFYDKSMLCEMHWIVILWFDGSSLNEHSTKNITISKMLALTTSYYCST
jgi:hypothetical protein